MGLSPPGTSTAPEEQAPHGHGAIDRPKPRQRFRFLEQRERDMNLRPSGHEFPSDRFCLVSAATGTWCPPSLLRLGDDDCYSFKTPQINSSVRRAVGSIGQPKGSLHNVCQQVSDHQLGSLINIVTIGPNGEQRTKVVTKAGRTDLLTEIQLCPA